MAGTLAVTGPGICYTPLFFVLVTRFFKRLRIRKKNEKNPLIKSENFSFLFFQPSTDIPDIPDRFPCGSQSP